MKKADKMFEKLGYAKVEDGDIVIIYEKPVNSYVQAIEFCHKASGKHQVISYEKGVNDSGFSNAVGLTIPEIKAISRKFKELRW